MVRSGGWLKSLVEMIPLEVQAGHEFSWPLPKRPMILVGISNQQFQGTIFLMVFDLQGDGFLGVGSHDQKIVWGVKGWCHTFFLMLS